jgi:hypothetical protein
LVINISIIQIIVDTIARYTRSQRRNIEGTVNPHNTKPKFDKVLHNLKLLSYGGISLQNLRDSTPIKRIKYKSKSNTIVRNNIISCDNTVLGFGRLMINNVIVVKVKPQIKAYVPFWLCIQPIYVE